MPIDPLSLKDLVTGMLFLKPKKLLVQKYFFGKLGLNKAALTVVLELLKIGRSPLILRMVCTPPKPGTPPVDVFSTFPIWHLSL